MHGFALWPHEPRSATRASVVPYSADPLVRNLSARVGTDPDTFLDHRLDVLGVDLVEERDTRSPGRSQHAGSSVDQNLRHPRAANVERHPHVAGTPLGEPHTRHGRARLGVLERVPIFDLQADQQLTVRVQGPWISETLILLLGDPPDPRGKPLSAVTPQTLVDPLCFGRVGIPGSLHEDLHDLR